ncbi:MAG: putative toxin-antitoxin system toxin component, PIN family [Acidobacteriota bacterium]
MSAPRVVLDTNVLVAASRSARGASAKVLSLVGSGRFEICISVPLVLEYEDVVMRQLGERSPEREAWSDILDFICRTARRQEVFFLWRPFLRDPKDEMVLELAVAAGCEAIVSYNKRDFGGVGRFGVRVCDPKEFLTEIGALR